MTALNTRKNSKLHIIEERVATPRAHGQVFGTSTCQDSPGLHLSFLFASFTWLYSSNRFPLKKWSPAAADSHGLCFSNSRGEIAFLILLPSLCQTRKCLGLIYLGHEIIPWLFIVYRGVMKCVGEPRQRYQTIKRINT